LKPQFSSCAVRRSGGHEEETFEEFSDRYDRTTAIQIRLLEEVEEDIRTLQPVDSRSYVANKAPHTDTKRNSMLYKMSSSFRYIPHALFRVLSLKTNLLRREI
jgi:hypothetical protein